MRWSFLLLLVLLVPGASAVTLFEGFETFNLGALEPETDPDRIWYDHRDPQDMAEVSIEDPTAVGSQWLRVEGLETTDASGRNVDFSLGIPVQANRIAFTINGSTIADGNANGTEQVVKIHSSAPRRTMVEFYVFCRDPANDDACELRVRWQRVDGTGQVLVNTSVGEREWFIEVFPDWIDGEFQLFVDGVDDGTFPFFEIPKDFGRIRMSQHRADIPAIFSFDNFTVGGGQNVTADAVSGDAAEGIKNFADDIGFTTSGSKFFLGILIFLIMSAAVLVPVISLGWDNTVMPALAFYEVLVGLWLVFLEFWPDWVGIALIILVASFIAVVIRRMVMGVEDASFGGSLVAGSLGYFVIATTMLGFSGYATDTIQVPTGPAEQQGVNQTTNPDQTFIGAVAECVLTGGVFTFGLRGDCSQNTVSETWTQITDVFGWVRTGFDFLFQLLTFQLPIPTIFNIIIVMPPAMGLAVFAIRVIRGGGA